MQEDAKENDAAAAAADADDDDDDDDDDDEKEKEKEGEAQVEEPAFWGRISTLRKRLHHEIIGRLIWRARGEY